LKKFLRSKVSGELISVDEAEFKAIEVVEKAKWDVIDKVTHLHNKMTGQTVFIPTDDYSKWGEQEKVLWENIGDPEVRAQKILEAALKPALEEKVVEVPAAKTEKK
jgi:hypothetical protein